MGKELSKTRLIIVILAVVFSASVIGFIAFTNSPAQKLKRQLDLGEKYLSELNYEQAVAAFTQALEISPDNSDAVSGIIKAYSGWGGALVMNKEYETAINKMDEARKILPENTELIDAEVGIYDAWAEYCFNQGKYDDAFRILTEGYEKLNDIRLKNKIDTLEHRKKEIEETKKKEEALKCINKENLTALANWIIDLANRDMFGKPMQDWTGSDLVSEIDMNRVHQRVYGDNSEYREGRTYLYGEECHYHISDTDSYSIQLNNDNYDRRMTFMIYDDQERLDAFFEDIGLKKMTKREFFSMFGLEGILDYWDEVSESKLIYLDLDENSYLSGTYIADRELAGLVVGYCDDTRSLIKTIEVQYLDEADSYVDRIAITKLYY